MIRTRIFQLILLGVLLFAVKLNFAQDEFSFAGNPVRLSAAINSDAEENAPYLSEDGNTLYFVRTFHEGNTGGMDGGQDIWYSHKMNGAWSEPLNDMGPVNNLENNVINGLNPSAESMYVLYSYGTNRDLNRGLAVSENKNGTWGTPKKVKIPKLPINYGHYGYHVARSEDVLFISFQGDGALGEEDLYICEKDAKGKWTEPRHLGPVINSEGFEISPYLSQDGQTLFFSSNGHGGMGDADIFMSQRLDDSWTNWGPLVNLGDKINSKGFDAYFLIGADSLAYYSSNKGSELSDLYTIKVNIKSPAPVYPPEMVTSVEGVLQFENAPAGNVPVKIVDKDGHVLARDTTDSRGGFAFANLLKNSEFYVKLEKNPSDIPDVTSLFILSEEGELMPLIEQQDKGSFSFATNQTTPVETPTAQPMEEVAGIFKSAGQPMEGIRMRLVDDLNKTVGYATTDEQGAFKFTELTPGTDYTVLMDDADSSLTENASLAMTDKQGQLMETIFRKGEGGFNFQTLDRVETASLSSIREEDVNGVFQFGDIPVNGVRVKLVDENNKVVGYARTNEKGEFKFKKLDLDASYIVLIDEEDSSIPENAVLSMVNDEGEVMETIVAKKKGSFSFTTLNREGASGLSQLQEEDVSGIFRYSNEAPAEGIKVKLVDENNKVVGYATTNEKGEFKFKKLDPDANYIVLIDEEEGTIQEDMTLAITNQEGQVVETVEKKDKASFNFKTLARDRANALGSVDENDMSGMLNLGNKSAAGVKVKLVDENNNVVGYAITDSRGTFKFTKLEADKKYAVLLDEDEGGLSDNMTLSLMNAKGEVVKTMKPDQEKGFAVVMDELALNKRPVQQLEARPNDIDGMLNLGNESVAGVKVKLVDEDNNVIGYAITDARGTFKFTKLEADKKYAVLLEEDEGGLSDNMTLSLMNAKGEVVQTMKPDQEKGFAVVMDELAMERPVNQLANRKLELEPLPVSPMPVEEPAATAPPVAEDLKKYKPSSTQIWFHLNSVRLSSRDRIKLNRIAYKIKSDRTLKVTLHGHTDNSGEENINYSVAAYRVAEIREYLLSLNVPKNRIEVQVYGEDSPIFSNSTFTGRSKNRIVVLELDYPRIN